MVAPHYNMVVYFEKKSDVKLQFKPIFNVTSPCGESAGVCDVYAFAHKPSRLYMCNTLLALSLSLSLLS